MFFQEKINDLQKKEKAERSHVLCISIMLAHASPPTKQYPIVIEVHELNHTKNITSKNKQIGHKGLTFVPTKYTTNHKQCTTSKMKHD